MTDWPEEVKAYHRARADTEHTFVDDKADAAIEALKRMVEHDPWSRDNHHNWLYCEHPMCVMVRGYEHEWGEDKKRAEAEVAALKQPLYGKIGYVVGSHKCDKDAEVVAAKAEVKRLEWMLDHVAHDYAATVEGEWGTGRYGDPEFANLGERVIWDGDVAEIINAAAAAYAAHPHSDPLPGS